MDRVYPKRGFNRREPRERRGFNRRGLFREGVEALWVPEVLIPGIESLGGFGAVAQSIDWSINGDENWRKDASPGQLQDWAAAEEVNGKKDGCPETPAKAAAARGVGVGGSGLCGLFVHEESVAQKQNFSPQNR